MRRIGIRRALSTKPSSRSADPQFIQEDLDEHGHVISRRQPTRKNTLLGRMFGRKNRHSEDDDLPIHTGDDVVVHPPMHSAQSVHDYDEPHSFAGAGTHLMNEPPPPHEHTIREHSVRGGHSVRDPYDDRHSLRGHSVRGDHSVHGGTVYRDEISRGHPTEYAASTVGGRTHVYEHDYGREAYDPHERGTVVGGGSPRHSPITATSPRSYHRVPVPVSAPATVIHETRDRYSRSGSSSRSSRTGVRSTRSRAPAGEIEVNLMPGEKQEFEIGPNTQLIVPDDVELEISDGRGGWVPYHESLLRRPPREEVYVISGGSNFIVEDELGNILHRSQPSTYSAAPVSIAGSVTGRSTRSRRDDGPVYVDG